MYDQVRSAVAVPLVVMVAVLGAVTVVGQLLQVSAGSLVIALAGGMLVPALVGARRAGIAADVVCRARAEDLHRLASTAEDLVKSVRQATEELRRGGRPEVPRYPAFVASGDAAGEVRAALSRTHVEAVQALIHVHEQSQYALLWEILRHFSRRQHALVGRTLEGVTRLEEMTDDPDLLVGLFQIDHLVTRVRRLLESLSVLGGESLRQARSPISVTTVLRGAVSEVVQYPRVRVAAGAAGALLGLPGYAGPDLSHLLAELIENGAEFSPPDTQVQVRAQEVPSGLAIEVEDRAMPMPAELRARLNHLLAAPQEADLSTQLREGKIGLLTAAMIAHRHGMSVALHENPAGGTTAVVIVPSKLLVQLETPALIPVPDIAPAAQAQPQQAADTRPAAGPGAGPAGRPSLPRRQPERLPPPSAGTAVPASPRPANPGLAAAFRRGQRAAQNSQPSSGPGESRAQHL
ncbi:sensor histidine kinase [Streptomyces sp. NPDC051041]|uniref:sensor histidine kinase n=1 Tax=Streptomyces sp. NPDC051041 TaxID=3365640 RepID=UPI0037892A89